mmetsp:Transcript_18748/g.28526  ORF Transcript_18748/g.28526 Transcript_18748/m.28526 type:complete len:136 (-) Transcript_18748:133-540(-)
MGGALGFSVGVVSLISLGDAAARTTNVVIKLATKFAFDSLPAMLASFGMTYPNQSDAEMIALYGYSKARPRQANRKIPRATNLPPPRMAAAFASWLMLFFVCEMYVVLLLGHLGWARQMQILIQNQKMIHVRVLY